ncbi:MAG: DUF4397 domain-containing protein, partial [Bacteroidetes bacterium]|nr:DUF4397 domain-containing protein [Bacteroidota bacterium]
MLQRLQIDSLRCVLATMALAVLMLAGAAFPAVAQDAQVQIIHNSPDPAAATVDIYIEETDGTPVTDVQNVDFRTATGFLMLAPGTYNVFVAGPESSGSGDAVAGPVEITLAANTNYTVVANGVLSPGDFSDGGTGNSLAFTLDVAADARPVVDSPDGDVELRAVHGSPDAPTVDVLAGGAVLVDDASYNGITGYVDAGAGPVTLEVTPGNDNSTVVASFDVDLTGFADEPLTVVASGFLDPGAQTPSPVAPFTLIAVDAAGNVIDLGAARAQIIHNAPDPGASSVDIYIDGELPSALDDFAFRSATPFIDLDSGVRTIAVAPSTSSSAGDALATFDLQVDANASLAVIASGVIDPSGFAPNPDGEDIAFELLVQTGAQESGSNASDVDLQIVHGSPDAPTVDAIARNVTVLADDATYTDSTPYISVPAADYIVDVTPADRSDVVASFEAELSSLGGGAAIALASGFLDPGVNQTGPSFGLIAVLPDGTVLPLPSTTLPLVINEIDADDSGTDDEEFVELYNASSEASVQLDPYILVFFNGNSPNDVSYNTVDLVGVALPPGGFFVIGNASVNPDITIPDNSVQNGADAIGLYRAEASVFPDDTEPTMMGLEDAFVYGTSDAEDSDLLAALGETVQYDEDENGNKDTESIQRFPDGSENIVIVTPTPANQNLPVEFGPFTASLDGDDVILNWTTFSETANAGFDVQQRSGDAPFRTVGQVEGQGTTQELTRYTFR